MICCRGSQVTLRHQHAILYIVSRTSPYRPFSPHPEQQERAPEVSGNTINGEGEREPRRAEYVYWHDDPDQIPHGDLQRWFYEHNSGDPSIEKARAERAKILAEPLSDMAPQRVEGDAQVWTERLTRFRREIDCDLLGVTRLDKQWLFEGRQIDHQNVIMIGVAHDYDEMRHAPDLRAGAEVIRQYGRGIQAAKTLASWIRRQGYPAEPHGGPMAGPLLLIPPAIACGFGELGRHGSLINEQYGSSLRLAAVTTDLPLVADAPMTHGVDDFCARCQVCTDACPPDAIAPTKKWVRGELKWYVDFDRCLPFFNENFGCGICVAVCPWSLPGRGPIIAAKMARRAARARAVTDSEENEG